MGWYLKKSFAFGPLRLNLSKSGLGASAGVTGLRVGTGPKGKYVHAGRGGVYYRKNLGASQDHPIVDAPDIAGDGAPEAQTAGKDGLARWIMKLFRGR